MALNDFMTLVRFVVEIEQIQCIQYCNSLKAEFEANPNTSIDLTSIFSLALKQKALLFHTLFEKGVFIKSKVHQDDTKIVEFIAPLIGVVINGKTVNSNFYRYWISIQKSHDPDNVNTEQNRKAIEPFLNKLD